MEERGGLNIAERSWFWVKDRWEGVHYALPHLNCEKQPLQLKCKSLMSDIHADTETHTHIAEKIKVHAFKDKKQDHPWQILDHVLYFNKSSAVSR